MEKWFTLARQNDLKLTGTQLIKKAKDFAKDLGLQNYTPSTGWLSRWKKRLGIRYRKGHGEKNSANTEAAQRWMENRMPEIMQEFSEDQIYNADETGLFFRAMPDGTLCFDKEQLSGSKKALDRITVLVCANMSGADKRKRKIGIA